MESFEDLYLTTELLNKHRTKNQKGGFVFGLIAKVPELFFGVLGFIKNLVVGGWSWLFNFNVYRYKKNADGTYKSNFSPHSIPGEGNVWKYLWWCIKTSFYVILFALGGFWVTIIGIIYLYSNLLKEVKSMKSEGNNNVL